MIDAAIFPLLTQCCFLNSTVFLVAGCVSLQIGNVRGYFSCHSNMYLDACSDKLMCCVYFRDNVVIVCSFLFRNGSFQEVQSASVAEVEFEMVLEKYLKNTLVDPSCLFCFAMCVVF